MCTIDLLDLMGQSESVPTSAINSQQMLGSGSSSTVSGSGTRSLASTPLDSLTIVTVENILPVQLGMGSQRNGGYGDDDNPVSEYSIDDGGDIKNDDGTAPILYPFRSTEKEVKKKKRKRMGCCRKKTTEKRDDDNMQLLRSYSASAGASSAMAIASEDSNPNCFSMLTDTFDDENEGLKPMVQVQTRGPQQSRRTRIPNRPDVSMSLWSIIKNAMGKDLTKLPLPVNFNEPLSMLQRLAEDYEYCALLDKASLLTDSWEQMAYVTAFTVSSYASTAVRTGKPFNPLLGETYECDRMSDLGWKCLCEQVSHHPPTVAIHCTGRSWVCWQQFTMSSKFRGNSIEINPSGIAHLLFTDSGNHYTWKKVPSFVHNIMIGKLWVDQEGEMDIYNHSTGDICHIKYSTSSFFRGEAKKVEGTIVDNRDQPKMTVSGYWDNKIEASEILKVNPGNKFVLGPSKLIWTRNLPPPESEKYYNFTILACQLNEMEDFVAPTDSRRRPDQRLMENGLFDDANNEKLRLEEKQRAVRKKRMADLLKDGYRPPVPSESEDEDEGEPGYQAAWFSQQKDIVTGKGIHMFKGDYWECKERQDWSRCADIY